MNKKTSAVIGIIVGALIGLMIFSQPILASEIFFPKSKISIGAVQLEVEVAKSQDELERGLMFRKKLGENAGMLFIYEREQVLSFWMKNTFIPLSIGFFNKNRELIDIQEMAPARSEMQQTIPTYKSARPAMYALEVNPGWFTRHKINLKAKLKYPAN